MKLCDAEKGKAYKIQSIGLRSEVTRRLEMLGMSNGTELLLLEKKRNGPVIVKFRSTRFALGKAFAEGIEVSDK